MELKFEIEGGNFTRAGYCSSEVKKVLKQLNIPSDLIKKIVVALYEAEVNVVAHAYRGEVAIAITTESIICVLKDERPFDPVRAAFLEGAPIY